MWFCLKITVIGIIGLGGVTSAFGFYLYSTRQVYIRLVPAQDVHYFYTRSHLSALQTVRYFSQPIFRLFSYLKNALHNLVIELCSAPNKNKITVIY